MGVIRDIRPFMQFVIKVWLPGKKCTVANSNLPVTGLLIYQLRYTGIGATTWDEANIQATSAALTNAPR